MRSPLARRPTYAALATADIYLAGSDHPRARAARRFTKPLLMPVLAAGVAAAPPNALRTPTLVAQGFSWGGDVALLSTGTPAFLTGIGSFGAGHAACLVGFHTHRDRSTPLASAPATRALAGVWLLTAPVLAARAGRRDPVLAPAVAAYAALLVSMTAAALHLDARTGTTARRLIGAGAVLFLASDLALALGRFVLDERDPRLERFVMATYTAGQALLAEGAVRAR